jgi:hypothetical protein
LPLTPEVKKWGCCSEKNGFRFSIPLRRKDLSPKDLFFAGQRALVQKKGRERAGTWRPKVEVEKRGAPQVAPKIFCPQAPARQGFVTAIFFLPVAKLS